ncbi:Hypothetical predicted protein, partial [Scomber scombrus]
LRRDLTGGLPSPLNRENPDPNLMVLKNPAKTLPNVKLLLAHGSSTTPTSRSQ